MMEPTPRPEQPDDWVLDRVRQHLDRAAEGVDPRPLFARIVREVAPAAPTLAPAPTPRPVRPRSWLRWAVPLCGLAATVAFLLNATSQPPAAMASPRDILEATQQAHRLPVDRCYLVEVRRDPTFLDPFPSVPLVTTNRLWTRGDRFFFLPVDPRQGKTWGRDERGNLWLASTPRAGARVESDEIPWWLAMSFEIHTLRVDQLLGEVLRNFDLQRMERQSNYLPATEVIRATPTAGRSSPMTRSALLEIDPETKVLRRLVIVRGPVGKPAATTTYTLIDTATLDPVVYSPEGHLREPFEIYTRQNQPQKRLEILRKVYGPNADKWFGPKVMPGNPG
jgi:hypothetical protein